MRKLEFLQLNTLSCKAYISRLKGMLPVVVVVVEVADAAEAMCEAADASVDNDADAGVVPSSSALSSAEPLSPKGNCASVWNREKHSEHSPTPQSAHDSAVRDFKHRTHQILTDSRLTLPDLV